ncbi:MAG: SpoIVB peptidase [Clostridia bacterium]|nr:SpoIVB peptidase [Clostridia bacterium]
MAKRYKKLSVILCLLLVCGIIFSPSFNSKSVSASSRAFVESEGEFDYIGVMSEPPVSVGSSGTRLSEKTLRSIKLYPGGVPFGVKFMTEGLLIVGFCDVDSGATKSNPSSDAGLRIGDRILSLNGKKLSSAAEFSKLVESSNGKALSLIYLRGSNEYKATLTPVFSKSENCYKTGVYIKDNGAGLGTVTYIVPNSLEFAGLGHGICEGEGGKLVPISRGSVINVGIDGVIKGQCGTPGELKGHFKSGKCGTLLQNTDCGVFGVFTSLPAKLPSEPLSLGLKNDIREGKAYIYCTLDGSSPQKYEIEISGINRSAEAGKCFTVKVSDSKLIEKTGGIVQGMSGSPIIQNGKLIGAVTHVMINDPTTGYGIFIENMLNAAQMPMAKAS